MDEGVSDEHLSARELREELDKARAEAARIQAINSDLEARNAHLELQNAKMRIELYGQRSERSRRIVDQLEIGFEEAELSASEEEARAAAAAARTTTVRPFQRKRPNVRTFAAHHPRERVVVPAPTH